MYNNPNHRPRLIKTPLYGIPLGEPIVSDDGLHYGLKIKKNKDTFEDVWLDQIYGEVVKATQPGNE